MTATPSIHASMSLKEWGMLLALSLVWGGSFFFNDVAVRGLPTFTVVVVRVVLGALVLLMVMRAMGLRMPTDRRVWGAFLMMGLLNNVLPFSLIVWGQSHLASGVAAILNASTPLFTVIVAHGLTVDEKMTRGRLLGVLLGFAGVAVMMGGGDLANLELEILAPLACLAGALSYACAGVYGRRFRKLGVAPMATATGQVCGSSLVMIPLVLLVDQPWTLPAPSAGTIGALIGVAVLSTAFAYVLYFRILETAGATNLLLVTFLVPVSAILLGIGFLGEVLLPKHLFGMALIGLGLSVIDGRLWTHWGRRERS
ncbi:MAG: DMT family transporter [Alphaproteobacteria bacterium]|nr:DMT family transporter [Alphaproteobacteria bacterium]